VMVQYQSECSFITDFNGMGQAINHRHPSFKSIINENWL
jgi:hypothetical protein